jgi:hypothetical protein
MIKAIGTLFLLAAAIAPARADKTTSRGASQEFIVTGSGGGYEVLVSPTFVTVFYLPEKVTRAFGSNQKDFRIDMLRDTVVVRPLVDKPGLTANLGIDTRKMKINVVLKIAPSPDEALSQVIFTRAEAKAEIDKKVAEQLAPLKEELDAKQRELDDIVRRRVLDGIAEAMLQDYELTRLDAITRNGGNVVLRVPRAIRMGDDRFLYFTLQNRSDAPYVVESATLRQDGKDIAAARAVITPRADGALGKVDAGQRAQGVIVIPAGQLQPGRAVELVIADTRKADPITLGGLRVP